MEMAHAVILKTLASARSPMPTTKLVKLVYLIDYSHFEHFGETLTGFRYMWDRHGPNALGHAIKAEAEALAERGLVRILLKQNVYEGVTAEFTLAPGVQAPLLAPQAEMVVGDILHLYGKCTVRQITARSKKTRPFRNARQYDLLTFEQTAPASATTEEDYAAHLRELAELGTTSQEDLLAEYGLS